MPYTNTRHPEERPAGARLEGRNVPLPDSSESPPFLFIIAGEPSGDALGAALIAALRERTAGGLRIAGIGGEAMAEQGLASLVPLADLAVAGVTEVLPRAPLILRRVRQTVAAIRCSRAAPTRATRRGFAPATASPPTSW